MKHRGFGLAVALLLSALVVPSAAAAAPVVAADELVLVRVQLPDEAMFDELLESGADIATRPRMDDGQLLVDLVLSGSELAELTARGAQTLQIIQREGDTRHHRAAPQAADTLTFLSAYWWTSGTQTFLQTQVATTAIADPDVEITVTWTTADGATGSFALQRFEDAGEYQ
jgi:hypothetical protein